MRQRKIRLGKSRQTNASEAYVVTIPPEIAEFYKDTYFTVTKSGTSIILISGALPGIDGIKLKDFKA